MNFTWVSWGFTELACLANLSQVGQCVSSAFLAHTMSLSDVCDSFSLYLWLYVCPKVDPLADQMLYMYGSTHFPVTLSPSRLLTTKRSTCAETRTQGGVWVREFLGSLSLAYFVRRLIIIQPPWLLTVARTKERKKNATFPFISDILKVSSVPAWHSSMLVLLCRCMSLRFQKVLLYSATKI